MKELTFKQKIMLEINAIAHNHINKAMESCNLTFPQEPQALKAVQRAMTNFIDVVIKDLDLCPLWDEKECDINHLRKDIEDNLNVALNDTLIKNKCTAYEKSILNKFKTNFLFRMALLSSLKKSSHVRDMSP